MGTFRTRAVAFGMTATLVAGSLAGCGSSSGAANPATPATPSRSSASASTCGDTPRDAAAIQAARARHPWLTDDLAAYAVSLLPTGIFDVAKVDARVGDLSGSAVAQFVGGALVLKKDANVAPAEFAHHIMQAVTLGVLARTSSDVQVTVPVANTTAADVYLKLAGEKPESTHGRHVRPLIQLELKQRLDGRDDLTKHAAPVALFATAPGYLDLLTVYFGPNHYRVNPATPDEFLMDPAAPAANASQLLAALSVACP